MSKYCKLEDVIMVIDDAFDSIPMEQTIEILQARRNIRNLPTIEVSEDCSDYYKGYCARYEDGCFYQCKNAPSVIPQVSSEDCVDRYSVLAELDPRSYEYKVVKNLPSVIPTPKEVIYGNEHNCIMTLFGECSYFETGCGDCAVVEKVREALTKTQKETQNSNSSFEKVMEEIQTQVIEFPDTHQKFTFTRKIEMCGDSIKIGDWEYKGTKKKG